MPGIAGGGSLGGVNRFGKTPCLDQRLGPELLFVLKLDLSLLNVGSPSLTVDTDRSDGARDCCSGVPKLNANCWFGVHGNSVSVLSTDNLELDTDKSFTCTVIPFGCLLTPEELWLVSSLIGRVDAQRLRGGGCKEMAPRDKVRLALSLLIGGWSSASQWTGCRSIRILRSMRRSIGSTRPEKGKFVVRIIGVWVSGVFGRNMPRRLRMLVNDSSLESRSCCFSKSTEAARDPERGRVDVANRPFSADTGPLAPADFDPVLWDVAEWEEIDEA